ncbi:MAG TPA: DUF3426 domain-containing protein [Candidatus Acidoferrales bacterium]|nr:DUF3426 domain-containing protein [Candidatus Acidoferrales bacterium]
MIEIQCTSCHTRYRIDERVLPDETPTFKCSRCGHVFNASPIPAKSRKPVAQSRDADVEPMRAPRPSRSRAAALKPPLEDEAAPETRASAPEAEQRTTESSQESDAAASEPEIHGDTSFERAVPADSPPVESGPGDAAELPEQNHPLDKSFADSEQPADTGESLKFDFPDDRNLPADSEPGPDLEHDESDDSRWEVGDTPPEFESAPAPRTLTVADAPRAPQRPAPTPPRRPVAPFKSAPPRFAEPPAQAKSAGFELGYLEHDDAAAAAHGKTHASGVFLAMFFVVALGFLGASLLLCDEPVAGARLLRQAPRIGSYFARPIVPAMLVALHDVQPAYRVLKGDQRALVITGTAQNVGTRKLHLVQIAVDLLDAGGRSLTHQGVFCGNELSAKMLGEMTPREIEFSQGLNPQRSFAMEPSGAAPFLMVFINPPAAARQFRISVTQAVPVEVADSAAPHS